MSVQKIKSANDYKQWSIVCYADMLGNYSNIESVINTPVDVDDLDDTTYTLTATGTGGSSSVFIPYGLWGVYAVASTWGVAYLQVSPDGTNWFNATDETGTIIFTQNDGRTINGNVYVRLNVTSYTNDITLTLRKSNE